MEELGEKAKELGIELYIPSFINDAILANWYKHLIDTDEFYTLFTDCHKPLSKFYEIFKPPTILAFTVDEAGELWAAMWFAPYDGYGGKSATVSAWTREDYRGTPKARETGGFCYAMSFRVWDVLVSITKHEGLLGNLRKVGYNIVGSIPHLVNGEDAWILYMTKEDFENSPRYGDK
jgi:hypothetical protein